MMDMESPMMGMHHMYEPMQEPMMDMASPMMDTQPMYQSMQEPMMDMTSPAMNMEYEKQPIMVENISEDFVDVKIKTVDMEEIED
ncbi:MAG: hypothetical protein F8N39_02310 [Clostridiaceae bacterium]|nr:hypothetical protein [Clostridiaceae bacterium]